MRKNMGQVMVWSGVLALGGLWVCAAAGQDKAAAPPEMPDYAAMMQKWHEMNAKGPEHEKFTEMVGMWDTEMKWWMAPGTDPVVSKGTAEFRLILDGRFIEQHYKCDMMGMPYEGLGIEGYDNFRKKYVSMWLDNQSTGIFTSLGTSDPSGKVFTYYGMMDDPMAGSRDNTVKSVAQMVSADKAIFSMYENRLGQGEFKTMEITYTRRAQPSSGQ